MYLECDFVWKVFYWGLQCGCVSTLSQKSFRRLESLGAWRQIFTSG